MTRNNKPWFTIARPPAGFKFSFLRKMTRNNKPWFTIARPPAGFIFFSKENDAQ